MDTDVRPKKMVSSINLPDAEDEEPVNWIANNLDGFTKQQSEAIKRIKYEIESKRVVLKQTSIATDVQNNK
jgi:hypothetical protein